jgi:glycine betaine/choline ABC-type transport system substrate-binding protein
MCYANLGQEDAPCAGPPRQEHAVSPETTLKKSPSLPTFLQPVFQCIDKKAFGALDAIFSIAAVPEAYWKDLKPEDFA